MKNRFIIRNLNGEIYKQKLFSSERMARLFRDKFIKSPFYKIIEIKIICLKKKKL
jgi:hypothetical protein